MPDNNGPSNASQLTYEKLRALMLVDTDAIYIMSPDWGTLKALDGRGFLADTREPDANYLDKYVLPEDQALVRSVIDRCIRTGENFELEHRVLRVDGSTGWTYSRAVPQFNEKGTITEWIGAASDITERRRIEEALRESEARYRTLFDSIDEGFCVFEMIYDSEGRPVDYRFLEINAVFEAQTGLVNAVGKTMKELNPVHEAYWFDIYGQVVKSGQPVRFVNEVKALNRWFDIYAFAVGEPGANQVATLFRDITEQKRTDAELLQSRERHAFLLCLSDTLRTMTDPADIHAAVTRMARDHFDSDRCYYNEIDGRLAIVRQDAAREGLPSIAGEYSLDSFPVLKRLICAGQPFAIMDIRTGEQLDESLRQFLIQANIISFLDVPVVKDGEAVGALSLTKGQPYAWTASEVELAVEIAERTWAAVEHARTEEALRESESRALDLVRKLEEADRNKNRFISVMSHELRNPLATIVMTQALLERVPPDSQEARRAAAIQKRQTAFLTRMVEDLLDMTRISENKIRLKLEPLDLVALVRQTVSDFQLSFEEKDIALIANYALDSICLEGDPVRLCQSVGNLMNNALKFTRPGDTVTITVSVDADRTEAVIRVADTGVGIEPETLERMFQPFTQADQALARTQGGLGLGLSIVRGMVGLHGGYVEATSEGIGKGAAFTIRLPMRASMETCEGAAE